MLVKKGLSQLLSSSGIISETYPRRTRSSNRLQDPTGKTSPRPTSVAFPRRASSTESLISVMNGPPTPVMPQRTSSFQLGVSLLSDQKYLLSLYPFLTLTLDHKMLQMENFYLRNIVVN